MDLKEHYTAQMAKNGTYPTNWPGLFFELAHDSICCWASYISFKASLS